MTQAPATPELVERLRSPEWGEFRSVSSHVLCQEAAAALEAQQARIAELEGLFADVNALCTEINKRWEASQALADRYEKALLAVKSSRTFHKLQMYADQWALFDQALSSQGRHEGGEGSPSRSQPCGVGPSDLTDPQSQHSDGEG
ncbi:MAG: hypothetical protein JSS57_23280 [Proteobacteria bacterium]|nr:hypothetical protein [Pseudomonadota bacterium]